MSEARIDRGTGEVADLVRTLIRNRCVNDGSRASGEEHRSADAIASYLHGVADIERYEPEPGRVSLVARPEGSDRSAPSLCLLGHTDVVPVNPDRWRRDPFAGEIVDGELWGRGAIDMLNLTASIAVAMRRLVHDGFQPRGTLVYAAVADEESGGDLGAGYLTTRKPDAVRADYVITESGGFPIPSGHDVCLPALVAERGTLWSRLRVRGTPSHGSMPFRTDNALVKAGEAVRRLHEYRPKARIDEHWKSFVSAFGFPEEIAASLLDPDRVNRTCEALPEGLARMAWSCTHTTIAPTVMRAGTKLNMIPDTVDIELDIRTLAGDGPGEVRRMIEDALGDLAADVEFIPGAEHPASESRRDTPLWGAMERAAQRFYRGARLTPMRMVGATDARWFRRIGATAYGFGLFSRRLSIEDLAKMGHGDDERIDLESLALVTDLWEALLTDFLA